MANVALLRRSDTRGMPEDFDMPKDRYGVGISWQSYGNAEVDVDLQCVVVDSAGVIVDCAYYNNMKAAKGVTHSGDEVAGKPDKIQEMVWVAVPKLPPTISVLVFVIAVHTGGTLSNVRNGMLHIFEQHQQKEIAQFEMERSEASVDVVAAMFKNPAGTWRLRIIDEPAQEGQHFMDILPLLADTIRQFLPKAPCRQKVAFAMEKGGVLDLPQQMNAVTVGLGWDVDEGDVDLDVSAILLDADGNDLEAVFFGRLESDDHGITHTGDNLTGEGEGDDEQIKCPLGSIGRVVEQVFFVINVYTPRRTFNQIANPYCRVVDDETGAELCRYSLRDAGNENGLIIARMCREAGDRWGFHALGIPCRGRTYKDSMPEIRRVAHVKTGSLAQRGGSFENLERAAYAPSNLNPSAPSFPLARRQEGRGSACGKCCVLQ